jgi:beta-barrel assembly-enhancing protease
MIARMFVICALLLPSMAMAQLGDLLRDPNRIRKGANLARTATSDASEEEEIVIGRIVAAKVLATYPLAKNPKLQEYVRLVGHTVASYSERPSLPWHFIVLESDVVNAFAAPGGYVFITTAALDQIRSEAELAAVLGHEIAHVTERHVLTEVKRANVFAAGLDFAASASNMGMTDEIGKKIGNVAFDRLFSKGLGRKAEGDSDRMGTELAAAAGYRSDAIVSFLQTLSSLEQQKSTSLHQLTSTHPRPDDRIDALRKAGVLGVNGVLLDDRWKKLAAK